MAKDPLRFFRVEARELVQSLQAGALDVQRKGPDPKVIADLQRHAHTLKGAARIVKQSAIADAAHAFEDVLATLAKGEAKDGAAPRLLALIDALNAAVTAIESTPSPLNPPPLGPSPPNPAPAPLPNPSPPNPSLPDPSLPNPSPPGPAPAPAPAPDRDPTPSSSPAPRDPSLGVTRIGVEELDALFEDTFEATVQLRHVRHQLQRLRDAAADARAIDTALDVADASSATATALPLQRLRELATQIERVVDGVYREIDGATDRCDVELERVRDRLDDVRLVAAETIFGTLDRAVHDAGQTLGKPVVFVGRGGHVRLDGGILVRVRDALIHAMRNAVDHGIESADTRRARGKGATGSISLDVLRGGGRVLFRCTDDGGGIDLDAVREAALREGKITADEARGLTREGAASFLLGARMSTKEGVTEISGRGVGLDAVRAAVERIAGTVSLRSRAGEGTTLELAVPVSLASMPTLIVDADGTRACLPLDAVRRTARGQEHPFANGAGAQGVFDGDELVPFISLAGALRRGNVDGRPNAIVLLDASRGRVALGVDTVVGTMVTVVKPLPRLAGSIPIVSGVTLDALGVPLPVLDVEGLRAAPGLGSAPSILTASSLPSPILVIDDSLTTRMLEQNILESAGYEVDVAINGQEGLAKARARRYGLYISDVEMPIMDGFEFVSRTRADPVLKETPAILVSSLSSPELKQRGLAAGAKAYIVKGEFDQGRFLAIVKSLLRSFSP